MNRRAASPASDADQSAAPVLSDYARGFQAGRDTAAAATPVEAELAELLPARTWRSKSVGMVCPEFMLAFIQRKLDEAKADGELLEKCAALRDVGVSHMIGGAVYFERAPTLRDALRKLVEEKP